MVELHVPVGCLKRITYLDLCQCKRLKSVSFIKDLESLEFLNVSGLHLKEFKNIILCHSNSNLQQLDFGGNDIENLPSSIGNLHKLVNLSFSWCEKLKSLPGSICSLQHLRFLYLYTCGIEELPEDIGQLECLEELDLSDSEIKHLPDSICKLKHLKTLILCGCKVCKLPENFGQIDSLNKLDLRFCKIRDIPSSIFVTSTKTRDVPSSICKLKHLKYLHLSNCSELEKLPENLGDLESLDTLWVTSTKIRDIPPSICKLKHLKYLNLLQCFELEKLPENLGDLESLDTLNVTSTKIRDVPSSICKLKHLKELYLSKCSGLEKLPENLGDLESLYRLSKLPENLGDLECLVELDITDTPISHLPDSISLLKDLKIVGYERRIDPDAILFQEQQHITFAPKRRRANTEATTSNAGDKVKDGGSLMKLCERLERGTSGSWRGILKLVLNPCSKHIIIILLLTFVVICNQFYSLHS
uniref:Putative leucine-rich repeat domain, L domain-like protein n=1 Tax=Helianthus annuus TaxID=4232 RepID=A0A251TPT3_HELAN